MAELAMIEMQDRELFAAMAMQALLTRVSAHGSLVRRRRRPDVVSALSNSSGRLAICCHRRESVWKAGSHPRSKSRKGALPEPKLRADHNVQ
jgi:hypothetical protein